MYRTKTYIAGDWIGDNDAIQQIYKWNNSNYWSLSFIDAHELTQARDSSNNCNIKRSLSIRLDASKTFVLIVGKNTKNLRAGSCAYCSHYYNGRCYSGENPNSYSFIEFEIRKALRDGLKIVVLYNSSVVNKSLCPESLLNVGNHVAMIDRFGYWDYYAVKGALEN